MLNNYRRNLKYTYKMLYPGVKFSIFLGLPVVVLLIGFYVFSKYIGIQHAELKLVTTLVIAGGILLLLPFGFITIYSVLKKSQETRITLVERFKRLWKLSPYLFGFILFLFVIYIIISFIFWQFGIPFFNKG